MTNVTLATAGLATHVKIIAIAAVATLAAMLIETGAQTRSAGSRPIYHAAEQTVARAN